MIRVASQRDLIGLLAPTGRIKEHGSQLNESAVYTVIMEIGSTVAVSRMGSIDLLQQRQAKIVSFDTSNSAVG